MLQCYKYTYNIKFLYLGDMIGEDLRVQEDVVLVGDGAARLLAPSQNLKIRISSFFSNEGLDIC